MQVHLNKQRVMIRELGRLNKKEAELKQKSVQRQARAGSGVLSLST